MTTTRTANNTKTALILCVLLLLLATAYWLTARSAQAANEASFPMTTNFVCEMQGKWSNEHYDISNAEWRGNGDWTLTYRDNGSTTRYLQRHGEDCRTESFPTIQGQKKMQ